MTFLAPTALFALALASAPQEGAPPIPESLGTYARAVRVAADRVMKGDLVGAQRELDAAPLAHRGFEWEHLRLTVELARERLASPATGDGDRWRGGRGGGRGARAAAPSETPTDRVSTLRGHATEHRVAAFSPTGDRIATAGIENDVRLWNARTGDPQHMLAGHDAPVTSLSFSPDGKRVVSASKDGTARVWESFDGTPALVLRGPGSPLVSIAWSDDGRWIATADESLVVRLWPADSTQATVAMRGATGSVTGLSFSSDGALLAAGSTDGFVRVWNLPGGDLVRSLGVGDTSVTTCAFDPANGTLLVGTGDGYLRRFQLTDGASLAKLRTYDGALTALTFTRDGHRFVTGSERGLVQVWDTLGLPLYQSRVAEGAITSLAFDARATRLVTCAADHAVRVLETDASVARVVQRSSVETLPTVEESLDMRPLAIDELCRRVVHRAGLEVERYEAAEALSASAYERMSESGLVQTTLGAARYRLERYEDALSTLVEASDKRKGLPANLAYRAMTLAKLAKLDDARAMLGRLETLMREDRWKNDVESNVLFDEARTVVAAAFTPKR